MSRQRMTVTMGDCDVELELASNAIDIDAEVVDEAIDQAARFCTGVQGLTTSFQGTHRFAVVDNATESVEKLQSEGVRARPVYRLAGASEQAFDVENSLYITFEEGISEKEQQSELLARGFTFVRQLAPNRVLAEPPPDPLGPLAFAAPQAVNDTLISVEPNVIHHLERFSIPNDPFLALQWHLDTPLGSHDLRAGVGIRAPEAWRVTSGERDIVVAVADDGFDLTHPDFTGEGKLAAKRNYFVQHGVLRWDTHVLPRPGDFHGSPCAGVAIGEANGVGTVGVAPGCTFAPVRFPLQISDDSLAEIFEDISTFADVLSCSWGYGPANKPMSNHLRETVARLTQSGGRRGKGLVICVAAGNYNCPILDEGNTTVYQFYSGSFLHSHYGPINRWLAAHPDVLTVSAISSLGWRSAYSSWGQEIDVCAPSDNWDDLRQVEVQGRGVFTVDNEGFGSGSDFTPNSRYTDLFGGTSSATPTVAGVAALVISANPSLSGKEVMQILKETASKDVVVFSETAVNIDGHFDDHGHSPWFGWGKVDAAEAVSRALQTLD